MRIPYLFSQGRITQYVLHQNSFSPHPKATASRSIAFCSGESFPSALHVPHLKRKRARRPSASELPGTFRKSFADFKSLCIIPFRRFIIVQGFRNISESFIRNAQAALFPAGQIRLILRRPFRRFGSAHPLLRWLWSAFDRFFP